VIIHNFSSTSSINKQSLLTILVTPAGGTKIVNNQYINTNGGTKIVSNHWLLILLVELKL
jgi:hypothetical protein